MLTIWDAPLYVAVACFAQHACGGDLTRRALDDSRVKFCSPGGVNRWGSVRYSISLDCFQSEAAKFA